MKNEYRYVTPDIMYSGRFTALDADMFREYELYNSEICISRIKKRNLIAGLISFCGMDLLMVFAGLYIAAAKLHEMSVFALMCLICGVYIYLLFSQIRKKSMNPVINTVLPLILLIAHPAFLIFSVLSAVISWLINKKWSELKERDGYPYFVMLVVDSKEAVEDEKGEKISIVKSAYENQKSGQTAEPDEIEVCDTSALRSVPDSYTDYFESAE